MYKNPSLVSSPGGKIGIHCCWCVSLFPCMYCPFALARCNLVVLNICKFSSQCNRECSSGLQRQYEWDCLPWALTAPVLPLFFSLCCKTLLSFHSCLAFLGYFACRRLHLSNIVLLNPFGNSTGYIVAVRTVQGMLLSKAESECFWWPLCQAGVFLPFFFKTESCSRVPVCQA